MDISKIRPELPSEKCRNCMFKGSVPGSAHSSCSKRNVIVVAEEHGVNSGWFMFPMDFDPCWLNICSGYRPKDSDLNDLNNEELVVLIYANLSLISEVVKRNDIFTMFTKPELLSRIESKDINGSAEKVFSTLKSNQNDYDALDREFLLNFANELIAL